MNSHSKWGLCLRVRGDGNFYFKRWRPAVRRWPMAPYGSSKRWFVRSDGHGRDMDRWCISLQWHYATSLNQIVVLTFFPILYICFCHLYKFWYEQLLVFFVDLYCSNLLMSSCLVKIFAFINFFTHFPAIGHVMLLLNFNKKKPTHLYISIGWMKDWPTIVEYRCIDSSKRLWATQVLQLNHHWLSSVLWTWLNIVK